MRYLDKKDRSISVYEVLRNGWWVRLILLSQVMLFEAVLLLMLLW